MLIKLTVRLESQSTDWTFMTQHVSVHILDLFRLKTYLVLPIHGVDVVLDVLELELGEGEDDLGHIWPADCTLGSLTQDPHPRAAHVANHVVTRPNAPDLDTVHAELAQVLRGCITLGHLTDHPLPGGNVHLGHLVLGLMIITILVPLKMLNVREVWFQLFLSSYCTTMTNVAHAHYCAMA